MARVGLTPSLVSLAQQQADPRAALVLAGKVDDAPLRAEVQAALASAGCEADEGLIGRVAVELGRLSRSVGQVQAAMLESGRRLLRLRELTGEGGYRALHAAGLIPIPETAASKLRVIAAAVDAGRVPAASLPRAVEAAAIVARLPEDRVGWLLKAGVIRPEATTRELREAIRPPPLSSRSRDAALPLTPSERRVLERRRDRLLAEVARIEGWLAKG
jgi:hypothetical protein